MTPQKELISVSKLAESGSNSAVFVSKLAEAESNSAVFVSLHAESRLNCCFLSKMAESGSNSAVFASKMAKSGSVLFLWATRLNLGQTVLFLWASWQIRVKLAKLFHYRIHEFAFFSQASLPGHLKRVLFSTLNIKSKQLWLHTRKQNSYNKEIF